RRARWESAPRCAYRGCSTKVPRGHISVPRILSRARRIPILSPGRSPAVWGRLPQYVDRRGTVVDRGAGTDGPPLSGSRPRGPHGAIAPFLFSSWFVPLPFALARVHLPERQFR